MKKYLFLAIAAIAFCIPSWGQDRENVCVGHDMLDNSVKIVKSNGVYNFIFLGITATADKTVCIVPLGAKFGDAKEFVDFIIGTHWGYKEQSESIFVASADGTPFSIMYEPLILDGGTIHNVITIGYYWYGKPYFAKIHLSQFLVWQTELSKKEDMLQYIKDIGR